MRYEVLPGLPPYGPTALPFNAGGSTGAWGGHSAGLVVRFHPDASNSWVGNFQPGSGGWEDVLDHPNGQHVVVVARGQAYVVDPETRQLLFAFSGSIQHVVRLPEFNAILFSDGLSFEAIKGSGVWWRSPRISWDEIRNIKVDGSVLRAEASTPTVDGNQWIPFTLNLMTGQCEGSIYECQMRRAVPIKPASTGDR
jgi:hypothetical protein